MDKYRIDSTKLMYHPARVTQWTNDRHYWSHAKNIFPIYVEISPSGACNHRCTFCAVDYIGYKSVLLDADLMHDRLIEMGALGVKSVMFAGEGEPLLHKRINDLVRSAKLGGMDVAFTTNGVLLDKLDLTNVTWVKVSVNAGAEYTYRHVHQANPKDWEHVWGAISRAVERKGDCTVGVQMVLLPENEGEAEELRTRCTQAGVDYLVLKPYSQHRFSLTRKYEGFKPSVEATGTVVLRENAIATTSIPYDKCLATPYFWAYIMANGDLYGCSAYLQDDRFNYGNLNKQTFLELWHGEKRKANWEYVSKHLDIRECRVNCRMHASNMYLNELVNGIPHINFV